MKGRATNISPHAETIIACLRAGETLTSLMRQYQCGHRALRDLIDRHVPLGELAEILRKGQGRCGKATGFKKGHVPWSKGRNGIHMSPATEFKPGCLRGQAARNWVPIGTVRVWADRPAKRHRERQRREGMPPWPRKKRRFIKIKDFGPAHHRWIPYARHVWREANGPIPPGMNIVHLDGDTMNDAIENLAMAPRRVLPALAKALNPGLEARRLSRLRKVKTKSVKARRLMKAHRKTTEKAARHAWECPSCGFSCDAPDAPDRCGKCGGGSFQRTRLAS